MSIQSNPHTDGPPASRIERKLLFMLIATAIVPTMILAAGLVIDGFRFEAMIAAVACQAIGFAFGYILCSGIVRQTNSINETLARINDGDFEARTELVTSDELGQVAGAINTICDNTLNLIQSSGEQERIQASIENLVSEMKAIAAGDLTITSVVGEDITGSIAASVNHMTQQLRLIVERVKSAAEQVTASSTQICQSSSLLSIESDGQAQRIGAAAQQLIEMTDRFQHVAELSKESLHVAVQARQTAACGLQAVTNTVDGMQRIRNQVQSTSRRIKRFGESSQEIGEIVQLISDIADQTSILALNASLQASMAGDAGHGFAIVAEEIERLAERSTDATKQISKLIRGIQGETRDVICEIEEATREVVAGTQLAAQAGETLIEIDIVSNQLAELIQTSSASVLQQADTASVVAASMSEIAWSTTESAERSREATRSVGQLADTVNQLRGFVSQFKVTDRPEPIVPFMESPIGYPSKTASPPAMKSLVGRLTQSSDSTHRVADLSAISVKSTTVGDGRNAQSVVAARKQSVPPSIPQKPVSNTMVVDSQGPAKQPSAISPAVSSDEALLAKLRAARELVKGKPGNPKTGAPLPAAKTLVPSPPQNPVSRTMMLGDGASDRNRVSASGQQPVAKVSLTLAMPSAQAASVASPIPVRQPQKTAENTKIVVETKPENLSVASESRERGIDEKLMRQIQEAEAMLSQMRNVDANVELAAVSTDSVQ